MTSDRRESVCWRCKAPVFWATFDGKPLPIERCQPGTGDLAFPGNLLGQGDPLRVVTFNGSGWRKHDCAPADVAGRPFSSINPRKART